MLDGTSIHTKNFIYTSSITANIPVLIDNSISWWGIRDKIISMNIIGSGNTSNVSTNCYLFVNATDGFLYLMPLETFPNTFIYITIVYKQ